MNVPATKKGFLSLVVFLVTVRCFAQSSVHSSVDNLFLKCGTTTPGYAIAIVKDGKVDYMKGYGMANLEYNTPITASTIFHLASVSKQFTAFCIYMLAAEGKLNLNDPVRKYLPDFRDYKYPVTILNLLQQTSGIRDQVELLGLSGTFEPDLVTQKNALDIIYRQKELNFKPGEKWLYSNSNYILLSEIVKSASGKAFPEYIQQNVFNPLEMNNSFINDDAQDIIQSKASSYEFDDEKKKFLKKELNYSYYGATNMNSTIKDLTRWLINFDKNKIGDSSILAKMEQKGILNSHDTTSYGSGLFIDKYKNLIRIFHDGNDAGFETFIGYFPEKKLGIVVLSNLLNSNSTGKAMRIANIYLQIPPGQNAVIKPAVSYKYIKTNQSYLNAYSGSYETPGGNLFKIYAKDTTLEIQFPDLDKPETLKALNDTVFHVLADMLVTFKKNTKTGFQQIGFRTPIFSNTANKVNYVNYDDQKLKEFTGFYYADEIQTLYEVRVLNNALVMSHIRNGDIVLNPTTQDNFKASKWYAERIVFQRDLNHQVVSLSVSSGRMKNVTFKKLTMVK